MSGAEDWKTAKLPTLYTKATKALIECATIDECRDWKSKMNAVASYARQVNDPTMMDKAVEIRNRARRRMGEILAGTASQQGAKSTRTDLGSATSPGRKAVANGAGISEYDRKTAMRVAAMPKQEFERRVKEPGLGQQRGEGKFITCPHCGGKIIR